MKKIKGMMFLHLTFDVMMIILLLIYGKTNQELYDTKNLVIIVFAIYCFVFILNFKENKSLFDLYKIFLIFYMIFVFGNVFFRYIFNYNNYTETDIYISSRSYYEAIIYSMCCLLSIDFGYNVFFIFRNKKNINLKLEKCEDKNDIDFKPLRIVGYILFTISVFFAVKYLYETMQLVLVKGYKGQLENVHYGIESIGDKLIPFFMMSLYYLVAGYVNKKKMRLLFFSIGLIYSLILIFLGGRGPALLQLLGLIIVYLITNNKKISTKIVVIGGIIVVLVLNLIPIISKNRNKPLEEWVEDASSMVLENENNAVADTISEMGSAIYPISTIMNLAPERFELRYGLTYINSLVNVLNFHLDTTKNSTSYYNIGILVCNQVGLTFGSSFIEEVYANFAWFGIVFISLFGYFLAYYSNKYVKQSNLVIKVLMIHFYMNLVWACRNTLFGIWRTFLYYFVSVLILNFIILKKQQKNLNYNIKIE